MSDYNSELSLDKLVFDKIEFKRIGSKNDNEIDFKIQVVVNKKQDEEIYRVIITFNADKEKEYYIEIVLSGFFSFTTDSTLDEETKQQMINQNTVAILMPYIRSQLSLLTAQPDVDCVVLPPFNITNMMKNNK